MWAHAFPNVCGSQTTIEGLSSLSTMGVPGFSSGLYLLRYLSGLSIFIFMISTEFSQDYLGGSGFGTIRWHLSRHRTEENDCPSSRIPQQLGKKA